MLQFGQKRVSRKSPLSRRSLVIMCGVISFFALGFATGYLGQFQNEIYNPNGNSYQNQPYTVQEAKSLSPMKVVSISHQSYENCIAYGSGESITITCPTQYGFVYKAILDLPKDLASKFSDAVFSIRGVALTESLDGSVTLHYQNNDYLTNFFAG